MKLIARINLFGAQNNCDKVALNISDDKMKSSNIILFLGFYYNFIYLNF